MAIPKLTSLNDCVALAAAIPGLNADQAHAVRMAIIDTYEFAATKHIEAGRQVALAALNTAAGVS